VTQNAEAIKADIRALPGLNKFLEKEAGHVRWHANSINPHHDVPARNWQTVEMRRPAPVADYLNR